MSGPVLALGLLPAGLRRPMWARRDSHREQVPRCPRDKPATPADVEVTSAAERTSTHLGGGESTRSPCRVRSNLGPEGGSSACSVSDERQAASQGPGRCLRNRPRAYAQQVRRTGTAAESAVAVDAHAGRRFVADALARSPSPGRAKRSPDRGDDADRAWSNAGAPEPRCSVAWSGAASSADY